MLVIMEKVNKVLLVSKLSLMQETDIKSIITQSLTETVVNSIKEMNIILGENIIRGLM